MSNDRRGGSKQPKKKRPRPPRRSPVQLSALPLADYPEPQVKSYPELSLEAMKRRQEQRYRVWLLGRLVDKKGCGWCTVGDLRSFVGAHDLFSIRTLTRALAVSCPFFRTHRRRVYLNSPQRVALEFDLDLRQHPVWIPVSELGSISSFRAALVASLFAHDSKMISQETLASLSGRCARSIRRYLNSEHVQATPNAMISRRSPSPKLSADLARDGYFRSVVDGDRCLLRRLPNTYRSDFPIAAFGTVKYKRPETCSTTRRDHIRRYFDQARAASRAIQSSSPHTTVYLRSPGHRCYSGHHLWTGFTVVPGLGPGGLPGVIEC